MVLYGSIGALCTRATRHLARRLAQPGSQGAKHTGKILGKTAKNINKQTKQNQHE